VKNTICKFAWLALCGSAMTLTASPPVIGVARSWGTFFVNDASVPGSATVFDGASLKTVDAASTLNLTGGERVLLASNTAAKIYAGRLQLDRGTAEFGGSTVYRVEARSLRIGGSDAGARVRVAIDRQNRVLVASIGGAAEVRNSRGMLVARVPTGAALSLSAANPDAVEVTGVVQEENGKFYLTDTTTNVKVQLRGELQKLVGKQVQVTGTVESTATASEPMVVSVTSATALGAGGVGGTGVAAGAGVAGGSIPTMAIVGGGAAIVTGGTLGGLYASGVIGSSPTVSR
jgi:hypothetical protein